VVVVVMMMMMVVSTAVRAMARRTRRLVGDWHRLRRQATEPREQQF
jgi:hypothetical protein